ncbi:MAG: hypothetical protein JWP25_1987 [Bradyrhizobium sp.]|nr:hypothetical protein [Bradyrhizobium sp.]
MTAPLLKPKNIVAFLKDGTACVAFFPYARELAALEEIEIDAACRKRFFVYTCSDAPVPPGQSGTGKFEELYPIESLHWARSRSTCMSSLVLKVSNMMSAPDTLVSSLMDLDAKSGNDDHRSTLTFVTDRPFVGDDAAWCRSEATQTVARCPPNHRRYRKGQPAAG